MRTSAHDIAIDQLRERIARLEGGIARDRNTLPFGIADLDRHLLGGGLGLGACMKSQVAEMTP
jgi:protein ImuA